MDSISPHLAPELERISAALSTSPPSSITVIVAPDRDSFMAIQNRSVPSWSSGTAYPARNVIYLRPLSGSEVRHSSMRAIVAHELTHLALHHKLGDARPPVWLDEGLAVFMADEPLFSRVDTLGSMAISGRFMDFRDLEDSFPYARSAAATAYAQSGDFVRFLNVRYGSETFISFLDLLAKGSSPDRAMKESFGESLPELQDMWAQHMRKSYGLVSVISGGGALWFLLGLLAIIAYWKKARKMKKHAKWEDAWLGDAGKSYRELENEEAMRLKDRQRLGLYAAEDDEPDDDDDEEDFHGGYLH